MRERRTNPVPNTGVDRTTLRQWIGRRPGLAHRQFPGIDRERWVTYHLARCLGHMKDEEAWVGYDGDVLVVVRPLEWDSELLEMPVWILEGVLWSRNVGVPSVADFVNAITSELGDDEPGILIHKSSPQDLELQSVLRRAGFDLLTVHLDHHFETGDADGIDVPEGYEFAVATAEDEEVIGEISAANYCRDDRFHIDPLVSDEYVPEVYREWARNSVRGYADLVCVARHEGEVVAFGTWSVDESLDTRTDIRCAWNGLACVDAAHQGRGVFRGVIAAAKRAFQEQGVDHLSSPTNALNTAALRCFAACGGRVHSPILTHRLAL